jgi:hypothetical protein
MKGMKGIIFMILPCEFPKYHYITNLYLEKVLVFKFYL